MSEINRFSRKGTTPGHKFTTSRVRKDRDLIAKEKEWIKHTGSCPRCEGPLDKLPAETMNPMVQLAMEQREVPFLLACWPCNVCWDAPGRPHTVGNICETDI